MVDVVQLVRASDCGSECRRFESDPPPKKSLSNVALLRLNKILLYLNKIRCRLLGTLFLYIGLFTFSQLHYHQHQCEA